MVTTAQLTELVCEIEDPELPHVSIGDLGIVRSVAVMPGAAGSRDRALIALSPTYTGCPAIEQIGDDVADAVRAAGFEPEISMVLTPAWSTDWITDRGRQRLLEAGIAPPGPAGGDTTAIEIVVCPRCASRRTRLVSPFGATACKATYSCRACGEPFELFKAI